MDLCHVNMSVSPQNVGNCLHNSLRIVYILPTCSQSMNGIYNFIHVQLLLALGIPWDSLDLIREN